MKHVRRLGVALLAFIVGVAVAPIRFYDEGSGRGKVFDGGGDFAVAVYQSSYFIRVWVAHESYVSPGKANEIFNQRLGEAVQVLELGPKLNSEGTVVGHRAVTLFFSPAISSYFTQILWTDGRHLHYVSSTSALHAEEFEKQQR